MTLNCVTNPIGDGAAHTSVTCPVPLTGVADVRVGIAPITIPEEEPGGPAVVPVFVVASTVNVYARPFVNPVIVVVNADVVKFVSVGTPDTLSVPLII